MKRNSMLTKIIAVLLCALMVAAWLPKTSAAANDDFESGMDRIYGTDAKNAMPLVIGTNADSGLANAYYAYTPAEDGTLTLTAAEGTTLAVDGDPYTDAVAVTAGKEYIIVATSAAKNHSFTAAFEVAPTGPVLDPNLKADSVAFNLAGYIGAQVIVNKAAAKAYETVYIEVVRNGVMTEWKENIGASYGMFGYEFRLTAYQMGDQVTITIVGIDEDGVVHHSNPIEWSARQGLLDILNRDINKTATKDKNRCKMVVEMLYYGAEAQKRFAPSTTLVTDGLDAKFTALHTTEEPVISATNTATSSSVNEFNLFALGLQDVIQLQMIFNTETEDFSSYEVKVSFGNKSYTYDSTQMLDAGTKKAGIIFDQLLAKHLREKVTVELYKDGNLVSKTYTVSIEGAAKTVSSKNVPVAKAMMTYGDAAAAYFA